MLWRACVHGGCRSPVRRQAPCADSSARSQHLGWRLLGGGRGRGGGAPRRVGLPQVQDVGPQPRGDLPRAHPRGVPHAVPRRILHPSSAASPRRPGQWLTWCTLLAGALPIVGGAHPPDQCNAAQGVQEATHVLMIETIALMYAAPSSPAPARRCRASPSACSSAPLARAPPAHRCGCWCTPALQQDPHMCTRSSVFDQA